MTRKNDRIIRAPRGPELTTKGWLTEMPLRMLMNNVDAEVAERPDELVVYGGIGRAARNWECFRHRSSPRSCPTRSDQTLLIQSGKPVGVFRKASRTPHALDRQLVILCRCGPPGSTSTNSTARA